MNFTKCHTHLILTTEQAYYLEYLNITDGASTVDPCLDGCSSPEIDLPYDFPFGGYYHKTAYVRQNNLAFLVLFTRSFCHLNCFL